MVRRSWSFGALAAVALLIASHAYAESPTEYRLTFPDYVHHVMDVDVTFTDVTADPLELRMSRTSPGRYALHEFAKNVFDVRVTGAGDRPIAPVQPNLHQWNVSGHGGTVRVRYRVFGDRVDGTYFGLDAAQAHINAPATLMWARGLDSRPVRLALTQPPGESWRVATQLFTTSDPLVFTAPNLQYLMDSPIKFGPHVVRTFQIPRPAGAAPATIRLALDHDGSEALVDAFAADLEKLVREQQAVFGELPAFDSGSYTFLATYRAGAAGDGMEHRNSTIVTSSSALGPTPASPTRDGVARVLSQLERRAHSSPIARAVQLRGSQRLGRAVAGRGRDQLLRPADAAARGACEARGHARTVRGFHQRGRTGARPSLSIGGRHEPAGALRRLGLLGRSARTGTTPFSRITRSGPRSAWASTCHCAT